MTMEWVFDIKDNDTYWVRRCWLDYRATYIVYGPLAAGATTVMFEGVPTFQMLEDVGKWLKSIKSINLYSSNSNQNASQNGSR